MFKIVKVIYNRPVHISCRRKLLIFVCDSTGIIACI